MSTSGHITGGVAGRDIKSARGFSDRLGLDDSCDDREAFRG